MRCIRFSLIVFFMTVIVFACAKKAGITGKVVDWKGQPMSGVWVLAKQLNPVKDYEHFQVKTDSNGVFQFDKVFPESEYELSVFTDQWKSGSKIRLKSGQDGKIITLPSAIVIRFKISNEGIIEDTKTGFFWSPMPEYTFSWEGAKDYLKTIRTGGYSDWRLPSRTELKDLYESSVKDELLPAFHTGKITRVWSNEQYDSKDVWSMDLLKGSEEHVFRGNMMCDMSMIAIRGTK